MVETKRMSPLRPSPTYSFTHEKIRQVAYTEAGTARRRMLHRRAFELLEEGVLLPPHSWRDMRLWRVLQSRPSGILWRRGIKRWKYLPHGTPSSTTKGRAPC